MANFWGGWTPPRHSGTWVGARVASLRCHYPPPRRSQYSGNAGRSGENTSELPSRRSTLFPYTTPFRSAGRRPAIPAPGSALGSHPCVATILRPGEASIVATQGDPERTRLNSRHADLHSFPTRRPSDLLDAAPPFRHLGRRSGRIPALPLSSAQAKPV